MVVASRLDYRPSVVRDNADFNHFISIFDSHPQKKRESLSNYRNHILIRHNMRKSNPLWNMSRARTPDHGILERLLQGTMNLIADIFDRRVVADNQGLGEIGVFSLSTWHQPYSVFSLLTQQEVMQGQTYRFVYNRINLNSLQIRSTTSCTPRLSSQLITAVYGS